MATSPNTTVCLPQQEILLGIAKKQFTLSPSHLPLSNCLSQIYSKYAKDLEQKMAANSFTSFYPSGLYTAKIVYSSVRLYTCCSVWCHLSCKLPSRKGTWHKAVRIWNQSTGHTERTSMHLRESARMKHMSQTPSLSYSPGFRQPDCMKTKVVLGPLFCTPSFFFFFNLRLRKWSGKSCFISATFIIFAYNGKQQFSSLFLCFSLSRSKLSLWRKTLDYSLKVGPWYPSLFLRCIMIYWENALQQINGILHCSKIIVRLFFFSLSLNANLCKSL